MTRISAFKELLKRPVAYNAGLARMMKSPTAAIMLSQGIYWQDKADEDEKNADGWFYVTGEQWYEQTGLTTENQATARRIMCAKGFWMEQRRGLPARLYFKIDVDELELQFLEFIAEEHQAKTSLRESRKQDIANAENLKQGEPETGSSETLEQLESNLKSIQESILKVKENLKNDFPQPSENRPSTLKEEEKKKKKVTPAPGAAKPKKEKTGRKSHTVVETFETLKIKNQGAYLFFLNNPDIWDGVIRYRIEIKQDYASAESEAIAMVKFWKDAENNRDNAEAMIAKTVAGNYKGFFPADKPRQNGYNQPERGVNPYNYG